MNRIQNFSIKNLFGYQNVKLSFKDNILILMGENGLGKTSILNSLYFTLTQKWKKLHKINFEAIEVTIDNQSFSFTKDQLSWFIDNHSNKKLSRYRNLRTEIINSIDHEDLISFINERSDEKVDRHRIIYEYVRKRKINREMTAPTGLIIELIDQIFQQPDVTGFEKLVEYLDKAESINILYFPTYRRVEEELHNLGRLKGVSSYDFPVELRVEEDETEELEEETLIQFGMEDVVQRIKNIIAKINDSSIKGFAKVTGEMLHQLQEGFPKLSNEEILSINGNNIEIILNRVKNNLSEADRNNILNLLNTQELLHKQELAYFLIKLEAIYLQQQSLDNSIKHFANVCNEYLVDKRFFFDESLVTLIILNNRTNKKVELNQLSSGEKQIVSLFSKLYLEDERDLIVFFDEPELSLSIKWQKQLLPHVVETDKCNFLLAVTHSPFIFNNELEKYAVGMNVFID
ncbi:AAA ATPase-like protein [Pontibacter ummariensis]|uniref:AAA ATPase domain-containing protein n=1 Tax=Pontibacter ummariensis TaxID=1610492 RepID=A0A239J388_9BACT|nr:AAA family ATPase [Pontibacter ummariensis]PRY08859.1 AAA ATPase-like protein [Pontibacter ummariensis]SNT00269.1 AAA ATPase domain-containing protein [Pontibacter ummariensis]